MNIVDELERLRSLYESGAINADEYEHAKAKILNQSTSNFSQTSSNWLQSFRRSRRDQWLGGICGALSEMTEIPSWVLRFIFCFVFFAYGLGGLVYILLWVFVPLEPRR